MGARENVEVRGERKEGNRLEGEVVHDVCCN